MAQAKAEPIYLLVTDLVLLNPRNWNIPQSMTEKLELSLYHLAPFKHWALQVRDRCYEVNSVPSPENPKKPEYVLNNSVSLAEWQETVDEKNLACERVLVGATTWSDRDIFTYSKIIWDDRFKNNYRLDTKNCQNFSYLLYQGIAVDPKKLKKDTDISFKNMPRRWTEIARFVKSTLMSSVGRAVLFEYITDAVILGAEAIGIESLLGLELLGLEIAGVALLGPIGEIAFAITIIVLICRASKDKKWMKRLKGLARKGKSDIQSKQVEDQLEQDFNEEAGLILNEIEGIAEEADLKLAKQSTLRSEKDVKTSTRSEIVKTRGSKPTAVKTKKTKLSALKGAKSANTKLIEFNSVREDELDDMKDLLSFSDRMTVFSEPAKSEDVSAKAEDAPAKSKDAPTKSEDEPTRPKDLPTKSEQLKVNEQGAPPLPPRHPPPPPYSEAIQTESKEDFLIPQVRRKPLPKGAVTVYTSQNSPIEHILSAR